MALETATFINGLVVTNPTATDPKSQGDDHLRLIKSVIKNTFTAITGAIVATHTELNFVQGVTSAIQTQLNAKGAIAGQIWSGIHNFTSATINVATQTVGDATTKAASTAFVMSTAFSAVLPAQTGNAGKFVTTDGTNASWGTPPVTSNLKLYFLQG
jgi:heme O synthase-like polyprenyltransferase